MITATRTGALAAGASYPPLTLTVAVSPTASASLSNTATVAGGGEVNTANDASTDVTAITQVADLTISKTHSGTFRPGDAADVFTITVNNIGAAPTNGGMVTVTDMLPAGLTPTAADTGTVNGWAIFTSGQTITATRTGVLAAGASFPPLTLTVAVSTTAPATVANTATVAGGGEVNSANDSATDVTATTPVPDLTISKSHTGNFRQGDDSDTYTVTVTNVGVVATDGSTVTVMDTLPAGLAPTAADAGIVNGWTVSISGQAITATRSGLLATGASYPPLPVTVAVGNSAPASVANTATVAGGGEVNTANDSSTDVTAITQVSDLTLTKTHAGDFHPGDAADAYTITVSNMGAVATTGVVRVTDTLPAGLTPTAADAGTINGWAFSVTGQTITATRFNPLASGGSYPTLTLTVAVANNAPASVTNAATVSGGGEINSGNDTATDVTTITPVADLQIAMSHSGNFNPGGSGAYIISVGNVGRAATSAPVTVTNTLPIGLTYAGPASANGWAISVVGRTITATRSDGLAVGANYAPLQLIVNVASNAPISFADIATVSGGGESNLGNDTISNTAFGPSPRRRGA
jgi:uncharacterized repeat protein (TIGR01451 family)